VKNLNKSYKNFIIAADVNTANMRIAIMGVTSSKNYDIILKLEHDTKNHNRFYNALNEALRFAKDQYKIELKTACICAAGPVYRKRLSVRLTNMDVEIDQVEILNNTTLRKVIMLNDFEARGYGIDILNPKRDFIKIPHVGVDMTSGGTNKHTAAVIGARGGLGMSIVPYCQEKRMHTALPSEGSRMDMVATNELETELIEYLKKKVLHTKLHPEIERVLSAAGLKNIFEFLSTRKQYSSAAASMLRQSKNIEKIGANYGKIKACTKTIDMFMDFYAKACKNLALVSQCYSGLYITDIICLRNISNLDAKKKILINFMNQFEMHDKKSDVLSRIPVYMVSNKDIGLYGCCNAAVNFEW